MSNAKVLKEKLRFCSKWKSFTSNILLFFNVKKPGIILHFLTSQWWIGVGVLCSNQTEVNHLLKNLNTLYWKYINWYIISMVMCALLRISWFWNICLEQRSLIEYIWIKLKVGQEEVKDFMTFLQECYRFEYLSSWRSDLIGAGSGQQSLHIAKAG